jgi:superfamily II DNA or RNA helicase
MAGLLCKELIARGDVERCLVVTPGSLAEQWQDELWQKFGLDFRILNRDMIEASRSGNPFDEQQLLIARLDHLSRNEDLQARLRATEWDLAIIDEAHKMSAHYVGGEIKATKRYRLGQLVGSISRHLLLMTATPHAGIEEDFRLFLSLLDSDRFEGGAAGRMRGGSSTVDLSDIMRRLVKEKLLTFDGRPLFPERRAYTVSYPLSEAEALLYTRVTEYVRDEMNRADRLKDEGEGSRGAIVGFALTTLQRRLASSPEAIYQSLRRRAQRLENRAGELRTTRRGAGGPARLTGLAAAWSAADIEELADELPAGELEDIEESLVDEASAARTLAELEHEIAVLAELAQLADRLRRSGEDRKWDELSALLTRTQQMFDPGGRRRKLIIFSEHRDTLNYLAGKLRTLLDSPGAVVTIHGGMPRDERRKAQEAFTQDPGVMVLVATDAAGEGINLQRAHLMVNYDLPWNPNRIEQRFGRIHRIGQAEVCHLWNLVAEGTREGQVFRRLFDKLDEQRRALGGQVFDVLGQAFRDTSLRELLIDAIRYGERPDVRDRLDLVVDATVGDALRQVIHDRALVSDLMTVADVERIRAEMERAEARKLQPHFTRSFFLEAFALLGGEVREREPGRLEIAKVPPEMIRRDRLAGSGAPLLRRYERVTFDKDLITMDRRPLAAYLAPGHPLLDATVDLVAERSDSLLRQGAVLADDRDQAEAPYTLVFLQHSIYDGRTDRSGRRHVVSRRMEFVAVAPDGRTRSAGWAPYLDLRPATPHELRLASPMTDGGWVRATLEDEAVSFGVTLARRHLDEVRRRIVDRLDRVAAAVQDRLLTEIQHWDHRATDLQNREQAGRLPASGMNSANARQRRDELQARLKDRLADLDAQRRLSSAPPVVAGGALVIPAGLLAALSGGHGPGSPGARAAHEASIQAVMAAERALGRAPAPAAGGEQGYDIESRAPDGRLLCVAVKTAAPGGTSFTVTQAELGVARNARDRHVLALVDRGHIRYVRHAFDGTSDLPFQMAAGALPWATFFERGREPW